MQKYGVKYRKTYGNMQKCSENLQKSEKKILKNRAKYGSMQKGRQTRG
jgi:hypothetical protein